jgi:hypothetical protein
MTEVPKTQSTTAAEGASIAYEVMGRGPQTLVAIHPWASRVEVHWEKPRAARFMRRLSRDLRVVHMDKAGCVCVFEDRGEHELKGLPHRWRLYAVAS